jgi:hypothetical protein
MSNEINGFDVTIYDDSDKENECCEHKKTAEIVDSLTKWVSTVDSKATHCITHLEEISEMVTRHEAILLSIQSLVSVSRKEEQLKRRVEILEAANIELGLALSSKLYKSEAKRNKGVIEPISVVGIFHPTVLPFIVERDESSYEREESRKK